jgi:hypothetical protein
LAGGESDAMSNTEQIKAQLDQFRGDFDALRKG